MELVSIRSCNQLDASLKGAGSCTALPNCDSKCFDDIYIYIAIIKVFIYNHQTMKQ